MRCLRHHVAIGEVIALATVLPAKQHVHFWVVAELPTTWTLIVVQHRDLVLTIHVEDHPLMDSRLPPRDRRHRGGCGFEDMDPAGRVWLLLREVSTPPHTRHRLRREVSMTHSHRTATPAVTVVI